MVSSRKTPSRTTSAVSAINSKSSQPTPANMTPKDKVSKPSNGHLSSSPAPAKSPSKMVKTKKITKARRPEPKTTFLDHLFRATIVSFIAYCLLVCPSDTRLEAPVCRALHSWRVTLQPHVSSTIKNVVAHPKVQPVIRAVQPRYNQIVRVTAPYAKSVQQRVGPHVVVLKTKIIVLVQPHIRKIQLEYDARIRPFAKKVQPYYDLAERLSNQASKTVKPYAFKVRNELQPYAAQAEFYWRTQFVPKVLIPLWNEIQNIPAWLESRFGDQAREVKHKYIDSQIRKMRAKIEELGGSRSSVVEKTSVIPAVSNLSGVKSSISSIYQNVKAEVPFTVKSATSTQDSQPIPTDAPISDIISSHVSAKIESVEEAAGSVTLSGATGTEAFISSIISQVNEPSPISKTVELSASIPVVDDDVELFLESLDITKQAPAPVDAEPLENPVSFVAPTREETANKRAKLLLRHSEWEEKISTLAQDNIKALVESIIEIRANAVASLQNPPEIDDGSLAYQIESFMNSAPKALKGTRAYAQKLLAGHYHGAEKIGLYDSVANKVLDRVTTSATALSNAVATWWVDVREQCDKVAVKLHEELNDLAGDAQADLGMDYAWLDDVNTADWKRYHDMKTSEFGLISAKFTPEAFEDTKDFLDLYRKIVEGSAPESPEDPLPSALATLSEKLQDYLVTFEADLQAVREEGFRIIAGKPASSSVKKEPIFSILPVADAREEFIGRGAEEVRSALSRAGEAVTGTPTPKAKLDQINDVVDEIFAAVGDKVHEGKRFASRAVGATTTPEAPREMLENLAAAVGDKLSSASDALPTVPSTDEVKSGAADVYVNAAASLHTAKRNLGKAAGIKVEPVGAQEYFEDLTDAAAAQASSASSAISSAYDDISLAIVDTAASASSRIASTVATPVSSIASSVFENIASTIADNASSASSLASSVAENVPSALHHATRSVMSAAGATPPPENFAESTASLKHKAHSVSRNIARAAGVSVAPEGVVEHIESVASGISSKVSNIALPVSFVASDAAASASSVAAEASAAVHSAVRQAAKAAGVSVEPDGAQEYLESIAEDVMAKIRTAAAPAGSAASVLFSGAEATAHSVARSAGKAAGVKVQPSGVGERMEDLADDASLSLQSASSYASSVVKQATRTVKAAVGVTPVPEDLGESAASLRSRAYAIESSLRSEMSETLARASSVVSGAYSTASSAVTGNAHEEL